MKSMNHLTMGISVLIIILILFMIFGGIYGSTHLDLGIGAIGS